VGTAFVVISGFRSGSYGFDRGWCPDLREHAIFTLHNLLEGNKENQAVVEAMELNHSPLGDGGVVPT